MCRHTRAAWLLAATLPLGACSPRLALVHSLGDELAAQGRSQEDDLLLARDAAPYHLKFSEALLRQDPSYLPLAAAVAAGCTQYAYAFVEFEAERLLASDSRTARRLQLRAARLYARARDHALRALALHQPDLQQALAGGRVPALRPAQVEAAYWAAAAWGAHIALSKDQPEVVADLPQVIALAQAAWQVRPGFGDGALASLMGTLELARPGGRREQAVSFFDQAIALGQEREAAPLLAKAEAIAQADGDRAGFEALAQRALAIARAHPGLANEVMRERAQWLLATLDERF